MGAVVGMFIIIWRLNLEGIFPVFIYCPVWTQELGPNIFFMEKFMGTRKYIQVKWSANYFTVRCYLIRSRVLQEIPVNNEVYGLGEICFFKLNQGFS